MTVVIVIIIRLLVPLLILKKPLFGAVLSLLADTFDYSFFSHFGWGWLGGPGMHYQVLDKILDAYYLSFEVYAIRQWVEKVYQTIGYLLYAWRFVGVMLFLVVQNELVLVMFPNVFETYFLVMLITELYRSKQLQVDVLFGVMAFCLIQKMLQEYALHVMSINWSLVFLSSSFIFRVESIYFSLAACSPPVVWSFFNIK